MEKRRLTIKDSAYAFVFSFLISQLFVIIVSSLIAFIFHASKLDNYQEFSSSCLGYSILSFTMFLSMFIVFLFFQKRTNNSIISKPKASKILIYSLIAIISFFALFPIVNCFDSLLTHLGVKINTLSYPLNTTNYFISLFTSALIPAVVEELLFRGIIFKGLKQHGKSFSIVLTTIIFAVYHMSISQTIYPLLFGLLLTLVTYKENNVLYCILMHFINNFAALTISYFNISLVFKGWLYIALAIVLVLIFLACIIIAISKQPKSEMLPMGESKFVFFSILTIMIILWIIINFNR